MALLTSQGIAEDQILLFDYLIIVLCASELKTSFIPSQVEASPEQSLQLEIVHNLIS